MVLETTSLCTESSRSAKVTTEYVLWCHVVSKNYETIIKTLLGLKEGMHTYCIILGALKPFL